MIIEAAIIDRPGSGEYTERIFDHHSDWNQPAWTYVRFANDDYSEWCGVFRGTRQGVALSPGIGIVVVLTSDRLYQLDIRDGSLQATADGSEYNLITAAPSGEIILSSYYLLYKVEKTIAQIQKIESPVKMDVISFKGWSGNKLRFTCEEFLNWDNRLEMELDCGDWQIEITGSAK